MAIMTRSEYARKRGVPRHVVYEACLFLDEQECFEESAIDPVVIKVLWRKLGIAEDHCKQIKQWIKNVEDKGVKDK